ncbi:MAG: hypothetical protein IJZ53_04790 [Tyzzerella sp.]|nr:hypothetical protein [Tyzzerella sp.]
MISEDKKNWAVGLLCQKAEELGRLPKKEDFDEITRSRLKAFLGPWPRALEAAGLKEAKVMPKKSKKRKKVTKNIK